VECLHKKDEMYEYNKIDCFLKNLVVAEKCSIMLVKELAKIWLSVIIIWN